jgi:hypothetical protein
MSELRIETIDSRRTYRPGETISGKLTWRLDENPRSLELRLFWYTEGKGDRDAATVQTHRIESPARTGADSFALDGPLGPYSFSGKLISLLWALELVVEPGGEATRLDLTIGPAGREVDLTAGGSTADESAA